MRPLVLFAIASLSCFSCSANEHTGASSTGSPPPASGAGGAGAGGTSTSNAGGNAGSDAGGAGGDAGGAGAGGDAGGQTNECGPLPKNWTQNGCCHSDTSGVCVEGESCSASWVEHRVECTCLHGQLECCGADFKGVPCVIPALCAEKSTQMECAVCCNGSAFFPPSAGYGVQAVELLLKGGTVANYLCAPERCESACLYCHSSTPPDEACIECLVPYMASVSCAGSSQLCSCLGGCAGLPMGAAGAGAGGSVGGPGGGSATGGGGVGGTG